MSDREDHPLGRRCHQRWVDLTPRGEGRYCGECDTVVVDLSRMTRREGIERIRDGGCVRMRLDERGEPIFRPDPDRRMGVRSLTVLAALAGGCTPSGSAGSEPSAPAGSEPSTARVLADVASAVPMEDEATHPMDPSTARSNSAAVLAEQEATADGGDVDGEAPEVVVPTVEQQALTRRKHARRAGRAANVPVLAPPPQARTRSRPPEGEFLGDPW